MFTAVFNYIIAPLLGTFGLAVPVLELPPAYYTLAGSIVWGLLGKKAWDATDLQWGSFEKRPKAPAEEPASVPVSAAPRRERKKIDLNDPEAVDRRLYIWRFCTRYMYRRMIKKGQRDRKSVV